MALTAAQRAVVARIRATMEARFQEMPLRARAAIDGLVKIRGAPSAELSGLAAARLQALADLAQSRGMDAAEAGALLRIGLDDVDTGLYFQRLLKYVPPQETIDLLLSEEP